jgi:2-oxoglutarate ferredoxin oxidoreductase subunit beta
MALYELPAGLKKHSLCPGCGHGIILRLIAETLEEMGLQQNKILVLGVGCSCNANGILGGDDFQCAHGRASAVATGMKLYRPDVCVITYQGDGDAGVIGLAETLNAAYRNENITVFTINNANFAMTGGQMSWTTLPGQKTTTSVHGRDCAYTGNPIHLPEMIAEQFDVAYTARAAVCDVKHINQAQKFIKKAITCQMEKKGYSMVEFLSQCPTNWNLPPVEAAKFVAEQMMTEYPVGEFVTKE